MQKHLLKMCKLALALALEILMSQPWLKQIRRLKSKRLDSELILEMLIVNPWDLDHLRVITNLWALANLILVKVLDSHQAELVLVLHLLKEVTTSLWLLVYPLVLK